MDLFRQYFSDFTEQYVLIGGAACDISFEQNLGSFRATRDLDIVLIVEAKSKEFGDRFWKFIQDGKYRNRAKSNGKPQFYRFDKPETTGYPSMIELFSRQEQMLAEDSFITPVHIDDTVSSLSAILLDDAYYELLLNGRDVINGISILRPSAIVPFKAKAWLDLTKQHLSGNHVDSRSIKKHKNDIIRIVTELPLEPCHISSNVKADMIQLLEQMHITDEELKNLKIRGVHEEDIVRVLKETYGI